MNAKGLKRITELSVEKADAVKGGAGCRCSASCSCPTPDTAAGTKQNQYDGASAATNMQNPDKK